MGVEGVGGAPLRQRAEDGGNSWVERGVGGGGRRGTPAFCSNFLERQTQTNSIRQLKGERGREKKREVRQGRN